MYSPAIVHSLTVQSSDDVTTTLLSSTRFMQVTLSTCALHPSWRGAEEPGEEGPSRQNSYTSQTRTAPKTGEGVYHAEVGGGGGLGLIGIYGLLFAQFL